MFEKRQIGQTTTHVTSVAFRCASIGNLYREVTDAQVYAVQEAA